jgi:hypothetical protein
MAFAEVFYHAVDARYVVVRGADELEHALHRWLPQQATAVYEGRDEAVALVCCSPGH